MKKVFVFSPHNSYWKEVLCKVKSSYNIVYWCGQIGDEIKIGDYYLHDIYLANQLLGQKDHDSCYYDYNIPDFLSKEEYYNYLKIMDRGDNIGGYSFSERDRVLKEQIRYWFYIFNKDNPDLVFFSNIPHLFSDYPAYLVAKYLDIKILCLNVTPFPGWHYFSGDIIAKPLPNTTVSDLNEITSRFYECAVKPYIKNEYVSPWYMDRQKNNDKKNINFGGKINRIRKFLLKTKELSVNIACNKKLEKKWIKSFIFNFKYSPNYIDSLIYWYYRRTYLKQVLKKYDKLSYDYNSLNLENGYVFVPLHYQPEATTAPQGGIYSDQIMMIEKLRRILPNNIKILVKEHYSQFSPSLKGFKGRFLDYWDKISKIDNTYLINVDCSSKDLIDKSLAIATVTGTAGWEALLSYKPVIVFGEPWYKNCKSIIDGRELENFSQIDRLIHEDQKTRMKNVSLFIDEFSSSLFYQDLHSYFDNNVERNGELFGSILKDRFNSLF